MTSDAENKDTEKQFNVTLVRYVPFIDKRYRVWTLNA